MTDSGTAPLVSPRVRRAFGLLERLAPAVGSRWAVELWCTPPLLLIHDPDDPDSPHETSERLAEVWPGATLFTTRGLGRLAHYRILRHRPAIDAGLRFIDWGPTEGRLRATRA